MFRASLSPRRCAAFVSFFAVSATASLAVAEESAPAAVSASEPAPIKAEPAAPKAESGPTPAEKKGAYALPFSMRPAIASNLVRLDGTYASVDGGKIIVSTLTGGYKPIESIPDLGFYVRAAWVHTVPDAGSNGGGFSNPLFFGLYAPEIAPHLRLAAFVGVTAPIGAGGGNTPDAVNRGAVTGAIYARQAMDNALFAVNYLTPTAGVGLAWIDQGFTAQVEVTVLELIRARGSDLDKDSTRTNFTCGLSVGYRIIPMLTASAELHYQRWLSTPLAVEKDETKRSQATFGFGLRANLPLTKTIAMRPGIGYFQGLDDPMQLQKYRILQLDVPIAF
jgi:hypothetical protein